MVGLVGSSNNPVSGIKMDLSASLDTGTAGGTVFIILMICAVLWAAKKSQDDQKL